MNNTLDSIGMLLRAARHPFHRVENRPTKAHQHRYERRKIREHLKACDWQDAVVADPRLWSGNGQAEM